MVLRFILNCLLVLNVFVLFARKADVKLLDSQRTVICGKMEGIRANPIEKFESLTVSKHAIVFDEQRFDRSTGEFFVSFKIAKAEPMLLFLNYVWVSPGDSVHVVFRASGKGNGVSKESLLISGRNTGGYAAYYFFRYEYDELHRIPKISTKNVSSVDLQLYKKNLRVYFEAKKQSLDSFLRTRSTLPTVRELLMKEIEYQELLRLIELYSQYNVQKSRFPPGYFDKTAEAGYPEEGLLNSKFIAATVHQLHLFKKDLPGETKFTTKHFLALMEDAKQYPNHIKEFLIWKDVDLFARNLKPALQVGLDSLIGVLTDRIESQKIKKLMKETRFNVRTKDYRLPEEVGRVTLVDYEGDTLHFATALKQNSGQTLLIDFWASWCIPCREEFVNSRSLSKSFASKPFAILYISQDASEAAWKAAIEKEGLQEKQCYRILDQENLELLQKGMKFTAIPHYAIFSADGLLQDGNAPRPSQKALYNTLDSLMGLQDNSPTLQPSSSIPPPPPRKAKTQ